MSKELLALLDTPAVEIRKKLFELGDFDFITVTDRGKNSKQEACLQALTSGKYRSLLYGGAAGGAKSWTGAAWLTFMCLNYPGTRWFVGREEFTRFMESTYNTFLKVFRFYGVEGVLWHEKHKLFKFENGSSIKVLELKFYPSDKLYERFGSAEFTGGWIEEGGEIDFGAYDVLKTRIGRHLNDFYNLKPTLFITCNPKKNWLYFEFYSPWKIKKLPADRFFIQAFAQDNPALDRDYISQLESISDKSKRERLLLGNWDYEDDPSTLCDFDAITDLFTNDFVERGERRIAADLAMKGRDRFVALAAEGLNVEVALDQESSTGKSIETDLKKLMLTKRVSHSRTVVDSDGLGNYLESYLTGIKEFRGGAEPYDKKEFANLKAECAYKLAEVVNNRLMKIRCTEEQRQRIIEELGVLKSRDVDADESRKRIIKKEDMKQILGRSPDYLDALIMLMLFEVYQPVYTGYSS